ncbi:peptidase S41-like protein [Taibaiella chishuiensis]|uniref:Peptidase S41-like protein n=1 Tax=Taibaiella chishuiensis TaxID=1434707 RepID=A0A2P8D1E8_9BACT|nr:peptidase S41-like protein [Taibaiella chishuiensis]
MFCLLLIQCVSNGYAQGNDIDFLIEKIRNAYAGYPGLTKNDKILFDKFAHKVAEEEETDTFRMLGKVAAYFDDHHLQVFKLSPPAELAFDSFKCQSLQNRLSGYFRDKAIRKDKYEGYWINDVKSTIIAIVRNKSKRDFYDIYYQTARTALVPPGFKIGCIEKLPSGRYLMDFQSPRVNTRFFLRSTFRNDSTLVTGDFTIWRKMATNAKFDFPNTVAAPISTTSGKVLDNDNYLLTLPDFTGPNISLVDSIVKADSDKIKKSKTLILDIRNNLGGTVSTYRTLVPYIATRPIIPVAGYKYCSADLLQHRRSQIAELLKRKEVDTAKLSELVKDSSKIYNNLGKFVFEPGDTLKYDGTMPMPKNVAIITNFAVQSAAELMVLDFKQSKKVKVFGENTLGAVDYLNAISFTLPSGQYMMTLPTFKREIPKGKKTIDSIGITPDVTIPTLQENWVEFVKKYYE